ncbi:MAG: hypothetical protein H8E44_30140 [Planctomycetes bacterium]|nr:hypothetical protein [Planctomycetota bacterium]
MRFTSWMILVFVAICVCASVVYAHICHSIFRTPGLLAVRPEKDVATLRETDTFKVYAQNNYIAPLSKVTLTANTKDEGIQVSISPEMVERLRPGERTEFTVTIDTKDKQARDLDLDFAIDARELRMRPVQQPTDKELRDVLKRTYLCGKVYAAEVLASRGREDGEDFLKRAIRRDPTLRKMRVSVPHHNAGRAACLVGRMGHKKMAPYLRERYKLEESTWIRGNIIIGLAQLAFEEDQQIFAEALNDADQFVKTCALLAMAIRNDSKAQEKLKPMLVAPELPVRIAAAWGRGIVKDEEAIAMLHSIVDSKGGFDRSIKNMVPDLPGDDSGGWGNYLPRAMAGEALLYLAGRNL